MSKQTPGPRASSLPEDALDFSDESEVQEQDQLPMEEVERLSRKPVDDAGLTGAATLSASEHEDNVSLDDLSPDTLFDESGARSPLENGDDGPADQELRTVDGSQIGAGGGLDEGELGRSAPLDGQPWTDEVVASEKTPGAPTCVCPHCTCQAKSGGWSGEGKVYCCEACAAGHPDGMTQCCDKGCTCGEQVARERAQT